MPANGAQPHAMSAGCNFTPVVRPQEPSTLCTATRHGTTVGYRTSYGCTCPAAVADYHRWQKQFRIRKARGQMLRIDATGTRRRIQALVAIGWTLEDLGARLDGITPAAVSRMARAPRVHVTSARKVTALYAELADTAGPSQKSARRARTRGWLPPLWWDDDTIDDPTYQPPVRDRTRKHDIDPVAVDRACDGQPISLTVAERHAAVTRLADRGFSDRQIAELLHSSRDAIQHLRNRTVQLADLEETG